VQSSSLSVTVTHVDIQLLADTLPSCTEIGRQMREREIILNLEKRLIIIMGIWNKENLCYKQCSGFKTFCTDPDPGPRIRTSD
jgi:hypothetical protein